MSTPTSSALFSPDIEKPFIAAVIRNPGLLADCPHIVASDFSPEVNRVVFSAIQASISSDAEGFSKFKLIDRLNSLGFKLGGVIEPGVYVNALELLATSDSAAIGLAKEIKLMTIKRQIDEIGKRLSSLAREKEKKSGGEIMAEATKVFNEKVNLIDSVKEKQPVDLYGTIDDFLDHENIYGSRSIATPFPIYNDLWGHLDPTNLYIICARMKVGKSTWLMSMLQQLVMADKKDDFVALILDTELTTELLQSRIIASLSGIKEFYVRHKLYKKSREMSDKVEAARELIRPLFNKVHHEFCGGMQFDDVLSISRRWAHKHVISTGKRGLLALDYFKLSAGSEFDASTARDITLGKKADAFKNLLVELQLPGVAFVQANRDGEDSKAGVKIQNTNVVAGSDMITQFCSNMNLLEKLSAEERVWLGQTTPDSATHSLKLIAPRQLGPNNLGLDCLVKYEQSINGRTVTRYCENYPLYSFQNFQVREVGTFKEVYERSQVKADVQGKPGDTTNLL